MLSSFHRVQLQWSDISQALALLDDSAHADFRPVPVGSHPCIDCASDRDATNLLSAFSSARRIGWRP